MESSSKYQRLEIEAEYFSNKWYLHLGIQKTGQKNWNSTFKIGQQKKQSFL